MAVRNTVEFCVRGRYALFSDPITRVGGEKLTYQVPTYQALKGILESVYWKPTLLWVIDAVRVMNPIRTEAKHIRPINFGNGKNDLSIYTYLSDVRYQVRAHFVQNPYRPELAHDYNEHKHHNIARRMIDKGGRRVVIFFWARGSARAMWNRALSKKDLGSTTDMVRWILGSCSMVSIIRTKRAGICLACAFGGPEWWMV